VIADLLNDDPGIDALAGLTHRRPRAGCASPGAAAQSRAGAGRQLALPLAEGDWPENRPILGRDGQYRLPLGLTDIAPASRGSSAGAWR